jgi:hypothetical protein
VEKESFLERSECELQRLARETAELPIALICGYVGKAPEQARHQQAVGDLYASLEVAQHGRGVPLDENDCWIVTNAQD